MSFPHCTFREAQVTVLPLHGLKNSLPSQLQKAHPSACEGREGSPRGATPMPTHPTLHDSQRSPFSHCVTLPACPKPLLWHWHLKHTQYRCFVPVRYAKIQGSASPLLGSTGGKLSWKERSAASTLHFDKRYKYQPTRCAFIPWFFSEDPHLFNFSRDKCCQMLGKSCKR